MLFLNMILRMKCKWLSQAGEQTWYILFFSSPEMSDPNIDVKHTDAKYQLIGISQNIF